MPPRTFNLSDISQRSCKKTEVSLVVFFKESGFQVKDVSWVPISYRIPRSNFIFLTWNPPVISWSFDSLYCISDSRVLSLIISYMFQLKSIKLVTVESVYVYVSLFWNDRSKSNRYRLEDKNVFAIIFEEVICDYIIWIGFDVFFCDFVPSFLVVTYSNGLFGAT